MTRLEHTFGHFNGQIEVSADLDILLLLLLSLDNYEQQQ